MGDVTYFTLADARYAVGAAAMVGSLRLTGHAGEVVVLDGGMTAEQRAWLAPHATLVPVPPELAGRETLIKPFAHTLGRGGVFVWLDADLLVTGALRAAVEHARAGRVVAARVEHEAEARRVFAAWEELLGLRAPVRRGQTYLCTGFVAFDTRRWPELLPRWWETADRIPPGTLFAGEPEASPFWAQEQDALNALLMSELPAGATAPLDEGAMAYRSHLRLVRVEDERTLACSCDGAPVTMLHLSWRPKPWRPEARAHAAWDAYHRLVPRVLLAPDAPVSVPRDALVPWLRAGTEGRRACAAATARRTARAAARTTLRALPQPVQRGVDAARTRVSA